MRFPVRLLSSALFCAAATLAAHADTINFNITGSDGTFSFSLLSTATPTTVTSNSDQFTLASAVYNGQTIAGDTVSFYTASSSGGFYLTSSSGSYYDNAFGPQIFTGSLSSPIFTPGQYTLTNSGASINGATGSDTGDILTIATSPAASTVPEPSTLALIGTGIMTLTGIGRRKLRLS